VQAAFRDSEYAGWRIDVVDMLEREGVETVYVIEAEGRSGGRETEVDLYYSSDGVLVKKVVDADSDYDYGDYIPARPTGAPSAPEHTPVVDPPPGILAVAERRLHG